MKEKQERFRLFLRTLADAPAVANRDEAYELLAGTLNQVEDEYSGVPYAPDQYLNDARMYPPQQDALRGVPDRPDWVRYRSRGHNTWITDQGAIRITTTQGSEVVFEKRGLNGSGFE